MKTISVGILRHLSISTRIKVPLVDKGALRAVLDCIATMDDNDILLQCAGSLANMTENTKNRVQMGDKDVLEALMRLSKKGDELVKRDVARSLCSLSSVSENHNNLFEKQDLVNVFQLLASEDEATARDAAATLGNLAITAESQVKIVSFGGMPPL
eukprot:8021009-Ditylum_brightwellii.AAC.1